MLGQAADMMSMIAAAAIGAAAKRAVSDVTTYVVCPSPTQYWLSPRASKAVTRSYIISEPGVILCSCKAPGCTGWTPPANPASGGQEEPKDVTPRADRPGMVRIR